MMTKGNYIKLIDEFPTTEFSQNDFKLAIEDITNINKINSYELRSKDRQEIFKLFTTRIGK